MVLSEQKITQQLHEIVEIVHFIRCGISTLEELESADKADTLHAMRLRTELRVQRNRLQKEKGKLMQHVNQNRKRISAEEQKKINQLVKYVDSTQALYRKKFSAVLSPTMLKTLPGPSPTETEEEQPASTAVGQGPPKIGGSAAIAVTKITTPTKDDKDHDELATVCSESSIIRRATLMGASSVASAKRLYCSGQDTPPRKIGADKTDTNAFRDFATRLLFPSTSGEGGDSTGMPLSSPAYHNIKSPISSGVASPRTPSHLLLDSVVFGLRDTEDTPKHALSPSLSVLSPIGGVGSPASGGPLTPSWLSFIKSHPTVTKHNNQADGGSPVTGNGNNADTNNKTEDADTRISINDGTETETAAQQRRRRWAALLHLEPEQPRKGTVRHPVLVCLIFGVAVLAVVGAAVVVVVARMRA
eukprot:TRINITY_DN63648_c0_g1_i2.p1 TRINITY_DN63648_c0_g1~~TRINITY_DN63648_c0_g1_i2.p1  ORF type:complete len:416 (+),score=51.28 TRINITY_DN63648_c0_g1_i2:86-1333(+)